MDTNGGAPPGALRVDPDELARAGAALADCGRALELVRGHLAQLRTGLGGWAVDGNLPWSAGRFLGTTQWLAEEVAAGCAQLSGRVTAAGRDYALVEQSAREGFERECERTP
jgi:hypothetical protein